MRCRIRSWSFCHLLAVTGILSWAAVFGLSVEFTEEFEDLTIDCNISEPILTGSGILTTVRGLDRETVKLLFAQMHSKRTELEVSSDRDAQHFMNSESEDLMENAFAIILYALRSETIPPTTQCKMALGTSFPIAFKKFLRIGMIGTTNFDLSSAAASIISSPFSVMVANISLAWLIPEWTFVVCEQSNLLPGQENTIAITMRANCELEPSTIVILEGFSGTNVENGLLSVSTTPSDFFQKEGVWTTASGELRLTVGSQASGSSLISGIAISFQLLNPWRSRGPANIAIEARLPDGVPLIAQRQVQNSNLALLGVSGGTQPLFVVEPIFLKASIEQSVPLAGVQNTLKLTVATNVDLGFDCFISISGMKGASMPRQGKASKDTGNIEVDLTHVENIEGRFTFEITNTSTEGISIAGKSSTLLSKCRLKDDYLILTLPQNNFWLGNVEYILTVNITNPSYEQDSPVVKISCDGNIHIAETEMQKGVSDIYGVSRGRSPLFVSVPRWTQTDIHQSTFVPGAINTISATICANISIPNDTVLIFTGFTNSFMLSSAISVIVKQPSSIHASGDWDTLKGEVRFNLTRSDIGSPSSEQRNFNLTMQFDLTNPFTPQPAPIVTVKLLNNEEDILIGDETLKRVADPILGVPEGADPFFIMQPVFLKALIGQESPVASMINVISVTFVLNVDMGPQCNITITGLSGATTPEQNSDDIPFHCFEPESQSPGKLFLPDFENEMMIVTTGFLRAQTEYCLSFCIRNPSIAQSSPPFSISASSGILIAPFQMKKDDSAAFGIDRGRMPLFVIMSKWIKVDMDQTSFIPGEINTISVALHTNIDLANTIAVRGFSKGAKISNDVPVYSSPNNIFERASWSDQSAELRLKILSSYTHPANTLLIIRVNITNPLEEQSAPDMSVIAYDRYGFILLPARLAEKSMKTLHGVKGGSAPLYIVQPRFTTAVIGQISPVSSAANKIFVTLESNVDLQFGTHISITGLAGAAFENGLSLDAVEDGNQGEMLFVVPNSQSDRKGIFSWSMSYLFDSSSSSSAMELKKDRLVLVIQDKRTLMSGLRYKFSFNLTNPPFAQVSPSISISAKGALCINATEMQKSTSSAFGVKHGMMPLYVVIPILTRKHITHSTIIAGSTNQISLMLEANVCLTENTVIVLSGLVGTQTPDGNLDIATHPTGRFADHAVWHQSAGRLSVTALQEYDRLCSKDVKIQFNITNSHISQRSPNMLIEVLDMHSRTFIAQSPLTKEKGRSFGIENGTEALFVLEPRITVASMGQSYFVPSAVNTMTLTLAVNLEVGPKLKLLIQGLNGAQIKIWGPFRPGMPNCGFSTIYARSAELSPNNSGLDVLACFDSDVLVIEMPSDFVMGPNVSYVAETVIINPPYAQMSPNISVSVQSAVCFGPQTVNKSVSSLLGVETGSAPLFTYVPSWIVVDLRQSTFLPGSLNTISASLRANMDLASKDMIAFRGLSDRFFTDEETEIHSIPRNVFYQKAKWNKSIEELLLTVHADEVLLTHGVQIFFNVTNPNSSHISHQVSVEARNAHYLIIPSIVFPSPQEGLLGVSNGMKPFSVMVPFLNVAIRHSNPLVSGINKLTISLKSNVNIVNGHTLLLSGFRRSRLLDERTMEIIHIPHSNVSLSRALVAHFGLELEGETLKAEVSGNHTLLADEEYNLNFEIINPELPQTSPTFEIAIDGIFAGARTKIERLKSSSIWLEEATMPLELIVPTWYSKTLCQSTFTPEATNVISMSLAGNFNLAEASRIVLWGLKNCKSFDRPVPVRLLGANQDLQLEQVCQEDGVLQLIISKSSVLQLGQGIIIEWNIRNPSKHQPRPVAGIEVFVSGRSLIPDNKTFEDCGSLFGISEARNALFVFEAGFTHASICQKTPVAGLDNTLAALISFNVEVGFGCEVIIAGLHGITFVGGPHTAEVTIIQNCDSGRNAQCPTSRRESVHIFTLENNAFHYLLSDSHTFQAHQQYFISIDIVNPAKAQHSPSISISVRGKLQIDPIEMSTSSSCPFGFSEANSALFVLEPEFTIKMISQSSCIPEARNEIFLTLQANIALPSSSSVVVEGLRGTSTRESKLSIEAIPSEAIENRIDWTFLKGKLSIRIKSDKQIPANTEVFVRFNITNGNPQPSNDIFVQALQRDGKPLIGASIMSMSNATLMGVENGSQPLFVVDPAFKHAFMSQRTPIMLAHNTLMIAFMTNVDIACSCKFLLSGLQGANVSQASPETPDTSEALAAACTTAALTSHPDSAISGSKMVNVCLEGNLMMMKVPETIVIYADRMYNLTVNITNPGIAQPSPLINISVKGVVNVTPTIVNKSRASGGGIEEGSMPLYVVAAAWTNLSIWQSSFLPGAVNTIAVTMQANISLPMNAVVALRGLRGSNTTSKSDLVLTTRPGNVLNKVARWAQGSGDLLLVTEHTTDDRFAVYLEFNLSNPMVPQEAANVTAEVFDGNVRRLLPMEAFKVKEKAIHGVIGGAAPLLVIRPQFTTAAIRQSTPVASAINTISVSFEVNMDLPFQSSIILSGASGIRPAPDRKIALQTIPPTFDDQTEPGQTLDQLQHSIIFQDMGVVIKPREDYGFRAGLLYKLSFNVTNPASAQPSPSVSISLDGPVPIGAVAMNKSNESVLGVVGGGMPLYVVIPTWIIKEVWQSTFIPRANNTISAHLKASIDLPARSVIKMRSVGFSVPVEPVTTETMLLERCSQGHSTLSDAGEMCIEHHLTERVAAYTVFDTNITLSNPARSGPSQDIFIGIFDQFGHPLIRASLMTKISDRILGVEAGSEPLFVFQPEFLFAKIGQTTPRAGEENSLVVSFALNVEIGFGSSLYIAGISNALVPERVAIAAIEGGNNGHELFEGSFLGEEESYIFSKIMPTFFRRQQKQLAMSRYDNGTLVLKVAHHQKILPGIEYRFKFNITNPSFPQDPPAISIGITGNISISPIVIQSCRAIIESSQKCIAPLHVIVPSWMVKLAAQSTWVPGSTNVVFVTLLPNIEIPAPAVVILRGLKDSKTYNKTLAVQIISNPANVLEKLAAWDQSQGELRVRVSSGHVISSDVEVVLCFTLVNPDQQQSSPNITIEARAGDDNAVISSSEISKAGDHLFGVMHGSEPLFIMKPEFVVVAMGQSTPLASDWNTLTLSLAVNFDVCAGSTIVLNGLSGAMFPEIFTIAVFQDVRKAQCLSPHTSQNALFDKSNNPSFSRMKMLFLQATNKILKKEQSIALLMKLDVALHAETIYEFEIKVNNPAFPQQSPSISVNIEGMISVDAVAVEKSRGKVMGFEEGSRPLFVEVGKWHHAHIGQSTFLPASPNEIALTLQANCDLQRGTMIIIEGLRRDLLGHDFNVTSVPPGIFVVLKESDLSRPFDEFCLTIQDDQLLPARTNVTILFRMLNPKISRPSYGLNVSARFRNGDVVIQSTKTMEASGSVNGLRGGADPFFVTNPLFIVARMEQDCPLPSFNNTLRLFMSTNIDIGPGGNISIIGLPPLVFRQESQASLSRLQIFSENIVKIAEEGSPNIPFRISASQVLINHTNTLLVLSFPDNLTLNADIVYQFEIHIVNLPAPQISPVCEIAVSGRIVIGYTVVNRSTEHAWGVPKGSLPLYVVVPSWILSRAGQSSFLPGSENSISVTLAADIDLPAKSKIILGGMAEISSEDLQMKIHSIPGSVFEDLGYWNLKKTELEIVLRHRQLAARQTIEIIFNISNPETARSCANITVGASSMDGISDLIPEKFLSVFDESYLGVHGGRCPLLVFQPRFLDASIIQRVPIISAKNLLILSIVLNLDVGPDLNISINGLPESIMFTQTNVEVILQPKAEVVPLDGLNHTARKSKDLISKGEGHVLSISCSASQECWRHMIVMPERLVLERGRQYLLFIHVINPKTPQASPHISIKILGLFHIGPKEVSKVIAKGSGVENGSMALHTIEPTWIFKEVGQSTFIPEAVDVINASFQVNCDLPPGSVLVLRGFEGSSTSDGFLKVVSKPQGIFNKNASWRQSNGEIRLTLAGEDVVKTSSRFSVEFSLTNPTSTQRSPTFSISIESVGGEILVPSSFVSKANSSILGVVGAAEPFLILEPAFTTSAIGQTNPLRSANNSVIITLATNLDIAAQHEIVIHGLTGVCPAECKSSACTHQIANALEIDLYREVHSSIFKEYCPKLPASFQAAKICEASLDCCSLFIRLLCPLEADLTYLVNLSVANPDIAQPSPSLGISIIGNISIGLTTLTKSSKPAFGTEGGAMPLYVVEPKWMIVHVGQSNFVPGAINTIYATLQANVVIPAKTALIFGGLMHSLTPDMALVLKSSQPDAFEEKSTWSQTAGELTLFVLRGDHLHSATVTLSFNLTNPREPQQSPQISLLTLYSGGDILISTISIEKNSGTLWGVRGGLDPFFVLQPTFQMTLISQSTPVASANNTIYVLFSTNVNIEPQSIVTLSGMKAAHIPSKYALLADQGWMQAVGSQMLNSASLLLSTLGNGDFKALDGICKLEAFFVNQDSVYAITLPQTITLQANKSFMLAIDVLNPPTCQKSSDVYISITGPICIPQQVIPPNRTYASGIRDGTLPFYVVKPAWTFASIGQSSFSIAAVKTTTVTLQANIDMIEGTIISLEGLREAAMSEAHLPIHSDPTDLFEETAWIQEGGKLRLVINRNEVMDAHREIIVTFNITGPISVQPSPEIFVSAFCEDGKLLIESATLLINEYEPLSGPRPAFTRAVVGQSMPFISAKNTLTVSIAFNVDVASGSTISVLGLEGAAWQSLHFEVTILQQDKPCSNLTCDDIGFEANSRVEDSTVTVFVSKPLLAGNVYTFELVVNNPSFPQNAPSISLSVTGNTVIDPIAAQMSVHPAAGVKGGSMPLYVVHPYWTLLQIGQSTIIPSVLNTFSLTLHPNIELMPMTTIVLEGLVHSDTPDGNLTLESLPPAAFGVSGIWEQRDGKLTIAVEKAWTFQPIVPVIVKFTLLNPLASQDAANVSIRVYHSGHEIIKHTVIPNNQDALSGLPGGAAPLKISKPVFVQAIIGQTTPVAGAKNQITITISFNVDLEPHITICIRLKNYTGSLLYPKVQIRERNRQDSSPLRFEIPKTHTEETKGFFQALSSALSFSTSMITSSQGTTPNGTSEDTDILISADRKLHAGITYYILIDIVNPTSAQLSPHILISVNGGTTIEPIPLMKNTSIAQGVVEGSSPFLVMIPALIKKQICQTSLIAGASNTLSLDLQANLDLSHPTAIILHGFHNFSFSQQVHVTSNSSEVIETEGKHFPAIGRLQFSLKPGASIAHDRGIQIHFGLTNPLEPQQSPELLVEIKGNEMEGVSMPPVRMDQSCASLMGILNGASPLFVLKPAFTRFTAGQTTPLAGALNRLVFTFSVNIDAGPGCEIWLKAADGFGSWNTTNFSAASLRPIKEKEQFTQSQINHVQPSVISLSAQWMPHLVSNSKVEEARQYGEIDSLTLALPSHEIIQALKLYEISLFVTNPLQPVQSSNLTATARCGTMEIGPVSVQFHDYQSTRHVIDFAPDLNDRRLKVPFQVTLLTWRTALAGQKSCLPHDHNTISVTLQPELELPEGSDVVLRGFHDLKFPNKMDIIATIYKNESESKIMEAIATWSKDIHAVILKVSKEIPFSSLTPVILQFNITNSDINRYPANMTVLARNLYGAPMAPPWPITTPDETLMGAMGCAAPLRVVAPFFFDARIGQKMPMVGVRNRISLTLVPNVDLPEGSLISISGLAGAPWPRRIDCLHCVLSAFGDYFVKNDTHCNPVNPDATKKVETDGIGGAVIGCSARFNRQILIINVSFIMCANIEHVLYLDLTNPSVAQLPPEKIMVTIGGQIPLPPIEAVQSTSDAEGVEGGAAPLRVIEPSWIWLALSQRCLLPSSPNTILAIFRTSMDVPDGSVIILRGFGESLPPGTGESVPISSKPPGVFGTAGKWSNDELRTTVSLTIRAAQGVILSFNVTNPPTAQPSADVTAELLGPDGRVWIPLRQVTKSSRPLMGIPAGAQPLLIVPAVFAQAAAGQRSPVAGARNTITVTIQSTVNLLGGDTVISIIGLGDAGLQPELLFDFGPDRTLDMGSQDLRLRSGRVTHPLLPLSRGCLRNLLRRANLMTYSKQVQDTSHATGFAGKARFQGGVLLIDLVSGQHLYAGRPYRISFNLTNPDTAQAPPHLSISASANISCSQESSAAASVRVDLPSIPLGPGNAQPVLGLADGAAPLRIIVTKWTKAVAGGSSFLPGAVSTIRVAVSTNVEWLPGSVVAISGLLSSRTPEGRIAVTALPRDVMRVWGAWTQTTGALRVAVRMDRRVSAGTTVVLEFNLTNPLVPQPGPGGVMVEMCSADGGIVIASALLTVPNASSALARTVNHWPPLMVALPAFTFSKIGHTTPRSQVNTTVVLTLEANLAIGPGNAIVISGLPASSQAKGESSNVSAGSAAIEVHAESRRCCGLQDNPARGTDDVRRAENKADDGPATTWEVCWGASARLTDQGRGLVLTVPENNALCVGQEFRLRFKPAVHIPSGSPGLQVSVTGPVPISPMKLEWDRDMMPDPSRLDEGVCQGTGGSEAGGDGEARLADLWEQLAMWGGTACGVAGAVALAACFGFAAPRLSKAVSLLRGKVAEVLRPKVARHGALDRGGATAAGDQGPADAGYEALASSESPTREPSDLPPWAQRQEQAMRRMRRHLAQALASGEPRGPTPLAAEWQPQGGDWGLQVASPWATSGPVPPDDENLDTAGISCSDRLMFRAELPAAGAFQMAKQGLLPEAWTRRHAVRMEAIRREVYCTAQAM